MSITFGVRLVPVIHFSDESGFVNFNMIFRHPYVYIQVDNSQTNKNKQNPKLLPAVHGYALCLSNTSMHFWGNHDCNGNQNNVIQGQRQDMETDTHNTEHKITKMIRTKQQIKWATRTPPKTGSIDQVHR